MHVLDGERVSDSKEGGRPADCCDGGAAMRPLQHARQLHAPDLRLQDALLSSGACYQACTLGCYSLCHRPQPSISQVLLICSVSLAPTTAAVGQGSGGARDVRPQPPQTQTQHTRTPLHTTSRKTPHSPSAPVQAGCRGHPQRPAHSILLKAFPRLKAVKRLLCSLL